MIVTSAHDDHDDDVTSAHDDHDDDVTSAHDDHDDDVTSAHDDHDDDVTSVFFMLWTLGDSWRQNPAGQLFLASDLATRPSHPKLFGDKAKYSETPVFGDKGLPPC
jgi:hypothetical protein